MQILGLPGVPGAGDQLLAMEADRATEISQTRQRLEREKRMRIKSRGVKLTDLSKMLARGERVSLNLVIKGDVDGSVQALSDSLEQLSTEEVRVQVIHRGVGAINESDVLLASTSGAIVLGFHVRPSAEARTIAERDDVDIRLYSIIYEAVAEVRAAMEGLLSPEEREVLLGTAEVRQIFKVPRVGTVAGCMVTHGELQRRGQIRVVRDAVQIYEGELGSPQALQGRRPRGARGLRVRSEHQQLQRPQGRRSDRVLPRGGGRPHPERRQRVVVELQPW